MLHAQPPGHQLVTATICNESLNATEIQCNHQITTTLVCHYMYYVCAMISPHRKTSTFNLTRQTGNSTTVFRRVQSFDAQRRYRRTGMGHSHRKFTHSLRQSTQLYCSVLRCLIECAQWNTELWHVPLVCHWCAIGVPLVCHCANTENTENTGVVWRNWHSLDSRPALPVYPPCDGVLLTNREIKQKLHCFHTARKKACSEGARVPGSSTVWSKKGSSTRSRTRTRLWPRLGDQTNLYQVIVLANNSLYFGSSCCVSFLCLFL